MSEKKVSGKKIFITIIIIILLCSGVIFALVSPIFLVKNIVLENNTRLTNEKILEMSLIKKDKNIFTQRYLKGMYILSENPLIKKATIYPLIPNGVKIYVEQRKEAYQISTSNGYYTLDDSGYILQKSDEKLPLIMLVGFDNKDLENKKRLDAKELQILEKINRIVITLDEINFGFKLDEIEYNKKNFVLTFKDQNKKVEIPQDLQNLRNYLLMSKAILESTKDKEGIIYPNVNSKRQYMIFREKVR